jgi:hypothetical protein
LDINKIFLLVLESCAMLIKKKQKVKSKNRKKDFIRQFTNGEYKTKREN